MNFSKPVTMSLTLKQAAEELLKIADEMEKRAAEVSKFVCNKCNHTTTLAKINAARIKSASEMQNVKVSEVTVNDKVYCPCPGCDGVLAYVETEESTGYYYDPEKLSCDKYQEEKDTETEDKQKKEAAEVDYDSVKRYMN